MKNHGMEKSMKKHGKPMVKPMVKPYVYDFATRIKVSDPRNDPPAPRAVRPGECPRDSSSPCFQMPRMTGVY